MGPLAPPGNRRLVALAGPPGRLLRAPPEGLAEAADMTGMIGDAKFQANDGGDASTGPQLSTEAIGHGPSMQQLGHAGELVGRQSPRGPGRGPAPEHRGAGFAGPCHPLTDGALADTHGYSNLTLRPALLLEVPCLQAPSFFPGVRCRIHASQSTTGPTNL